MGEDEHEEMGVIRDCHVGCRDVNRPVMWCEVEMLNYSVLQVFGLVMATNGGCSRFVRLK